MCAQFYKILPGERNLCFTFLIRPTGAVWVHPNATWHFWTVLIFQYYDQRLVMQPAWIISVHSVQAWLFETSPVLGLQGAGGSKNTISQVVSHELKIAEHSFPVRLPHCPPNPPAFLLRSNLSPPPSSLHPSTIHSAHCSVSWQKAAFPATWWRNLPEWKKKEGERKRRGEKKNLPTDLDTDTWPTYPLPRPTHPPAVLRLSSEDVFTMFYHPIFLECTSGTCELDGKRGENVAQTPQRSCVSELSRSPRRRPLPPTARAAP